MARVVVLPLLLAFLLSLLLAPVVRVLRQLKIPRWIASGVVVIGLVAGTGTLVYYLASPVADWIVPPLVYLGLTALEGSFVTPTILGTRLTLNPLMIFASIIFWGWMWGAVGAILAVPLLASMKIVCDDVERLHPVGELLGG